MSPGAAFNTWGVFAISYATGTLHLARVPVLIAVTVAALLMAVLLPVSGLLADRFGPRPVYASGIAAYGLAVFPVFALFQHAQHHRVCARNVVGVRGYSRLVLWRAGNTLRFAVPARIRYTGLSTVYQLSGVYASGLTPLILTALIAAADSPYRRQEGCLPPLFLIANINSGGKPAFRTALGQLALFIAPFRLCGRFLTPRQSRLSGQLRQVAKVSSISSIGIYERKNPCIIKLSAREVEGSRRQISGWSPERSRGSSKCEL